MQSSVLEFADKLTEIMPVIMKEFARRMMGQDLYKAKVTVPQIFILDFLNKHGETKMSDMARYMKVSTAAMTGIVDRLVRDKDVVRTPDQDDRRIIKIKLTPKGDALIKSVNLQRRQLITRVFGKISEEDRRDYLRILFQIKNILTQDGPTLA